MILILLFAFLAGLFTILSPCILPILPIVLSSGVGSVSSRARPYGVITGFVLSFTFFTLFLSILVQALGFSPELLRYIAIVTVGVFGISLLIPRFQLYSEMLFSRFSRFLPQSQKSSGFGGGFLIGLSIGLLWTPCVGPILASVISLALSGTVTFEAFLITLAYSLGTALPMLFLIKGGQQLTKKLPLVYKHLGLVQKGFGVLMILTAVGLYFGADKMFQQYAVETFPGYEQAILMFENQEFVRDWVDGMGL